MIEAIICDWNRTLFEDYYEEIFFKGIFKHVIFENIKKLNAKKLLVLLRARDECIKSYRFRDGDMRGSIINILAALNEHLINGLSVSFIKQYTERYAISAINRLDRKILDPLKRLKIANGIKLGIISSGYKTGIRQILDKAGYLFDIIEANDFEINDNTIIKFRLNIFDNKLYVLQKILFDNRINSSNVIYIGDDMQDEACFKNVGYPIVSFLANDYHRNYFFQKIKAFLPNNANEFENYLLRMMNYGG